ncbi:MAG TPA: alpha/beta hydrolase [Hyphomicrobiaceae bacterium]|nr:alpha/beta hydrolase [Hyphomicrobiaceae bacterium]
MVIADISAQVIRATQHWCAREHFVRLVLLAGLLGCLTAPAAAQQHARRVATSGWIMSAVPTPHAVISRQGPLPKSVTRLAALNSAPFPYEGTMPGANQPFIEIDQATGRRFHRTPGGRVYWEDERYNDPRVLLHIPRGFDIRRPGLLVLYFHGHRANLRRDVFMRQRVPWQISMSRTNAVLAAPQFAVNASDSSAGKLWQRGALRDLVSEAAARLAIMHGDPRSEPSFANLPIVIVAYSGGVGPAAWAVRNGDLGSRLRGIVLMDAAYGEMGVFADWIARTPNAFLLSTYTNSTEARNRELKTLIEARGIKALDTVPPRIEPGHVAIVPAASNATHHDFLLRAWADYPLRDLLARVRGYPRG